MQSIYIFTANKIMLKKLSGGSSLWKSKNPHSLEYLRYLQGVLVKNDKIVDGNRALVIEALRAITEILIWGDQNDAAVFDFFLERQMFLHFLRIMQQTEANYVNIQLLQTLNILFENIRNETSLYFLLSNNHVNSIITFGFDFTNEEIIAYYISFLKTLSFKLNVKTVHFFFSESTDEFPLFTEAIKFYKHNESMVRIAVRTLTLNIFKINEETLNNFVIQHSREYFNDVCSEAAIQIIEMDTFARSAQNESSNRNRLLQLMDVHMDNLHYINDILSIGKEKLNTLIIESLHRFLIGPIYLASLASLRAQPQTILVSRVTALFLFSQFLRIVHETNTVQSVLTPLFFGDHGDIRTEWLRTLDKGLHLEPIGKKWEKQPTQEERGSFHSQLIAALHEGQQDDHACLFALLLIQCIFQNTGVPKDLFDAAQLPSPNNSTKIQQCDPEMAECLLRIVENCSLTDTQIRPVTLELCCMILRHILICLESADQTFYSTIDSTVKKTQHKLTNILKGALQTEKLFLEMFEDEFYQLQKNELKISTLLEDPGLYLPPSNTPLSGLNLTKRIPSGNDERNRRSLQFYFIIRRFGQDLSGESEKLLPLSSRIQPMVELNDCINLNNSDLLSVTVHSTDKNERQSRFLVTDQFQLILVEPDSRRLGWAIVRFVGLLQDVQITGTSDSRALNVVVEDVKTRAAQPNSRPLLSAKFVFDDHIRCMAAKQRLNRGRKRSRTYKLGLIAELFGMRLPQQQQGGGTAGLNSLPNSPQLGGGIQRHRLVSVPGSVQKLFSPSIPAQNNDQQQQQFEQIPPDPDTGTSAGSGVSKADRGGRIHHI